MMTWWNDFCQVVGDALLGWSLRLPSDVTLLIVAALSAVIFTLIRWATTDQDRLCRAAVDKKQLKRLIREARSRKDRSVLARVRATLGKIRRMSLVSEIVPMLVAMGPIAVLATWCALRLEFQPPRAGQSMALEVMTPGGAEGQLIHLVPEKGITTDGWIKQIQAVSDTSGRRGLATWEIAAAARETPYTLTVRYGSENLQHVLLVGARKYAPPVVQHNPEVTSVLRYEPVRLLGWLPGLPTIGAPPWLVAYLVLTLPLVLLLRFLFEVN